MRDTATTRELYQYLTSYNYIAGDDLKLQIIGPSFFARLLLLLSYLQVDETEISQFLQLYRESKS